MIFVGFVFHDVSSGTNCKCYGSVIIKTFLKMYCKMYLKRHRHTPIPIIYLSFSNLCVLITFLLAICELILMYG